MQLFVLQLQYFQIVTKSNFFYISKKQVCGVGVRVGITHRRIQRGGGHMAMAPHKAPENGTKSTHFWT